MNRLSLVSMVSGLIVLLFLTIPNSEAYQEIEVPNGGTITGEVKFTGKLEVSVPLEVTKDVSFCGTQKPSEVLVVSKNGRVKNAVITIENVEKGKKISRENSHVDNKDCVFVPHVQAMSKGNYLEIINSDPILHNTHGYLNKTRTIFNLGLPFQNQKVKKRMRRPGIINLECDVGHTWMSAYIVVVDHPYFAVTDESGAFEISEIPPGKYQLKAWHEKLGTQIIEVTVTEKGKTKAVFDLP
jgi:hypothetical protein